MSDTAGDYCFSSDHYAGTGVSAYTGDGGPAINATFNTIMDAKLGRDGNLYIVDQNNNRIRVVNVLTGIVTTFAGGSSDGCPNTSLAAPLTLCQPQGIGVAPAGDLYIADNANNRVVKVASDGTITLVAGTGNLTGDYSGSRDVDIAGDLYIADMRDNRIRLDGLTIPPFSATLVGSASVKNIYLDINQDLQVTSITVPTSFGGSKEFSPGAMLDCAMNATLTAGTICTVPVTFTPAYPGKRALPPVVNSTAGTFIFPLAGIGDACDHAGNYRHRYPERRTSAGGDTYWLIADAGAKPLGIILNVVHKLAN